jgi:hypothetical protein
MIQNKIVVRYLNGNVLKGFTTDFMPNKEMFHLALADAQPGAPLVTVKISECKALFFVRDFDGNAAYHDRKEFDPTKNAGGRKIKVVFKDSETLIGTTQGYDPGRQGFFFFPADPASNNERGYVVNAATKEVSFI